MVTFDSLHLDPLILDNVRALGYETLTPIQQKAIPPVLEGRDVVALAQTGTGKTAAFALPMVQRLMRGAQGRLRALIVGPTRELAEQTREVLAELGAHTGLRMVAIYGGVSMQAQVAALRRGVDIAIACPGRLLDHVRQGTIRLSHIECLVLDEADRMFDMGFLPDIRRILERLPARRQTVLLSATMPDEIRRLTGSVLRDPVTVQIAHSRPADSVSHALYPVRQHLKAPLLLAILHRTDRESVLVFTRTKQRAKRLTQQLSDAGHTAACLQGNLSQGRRKAAMDGFRSGQYRILVATDLAARGIDVAAISHVINFDMPHTADDYTHRIGRTGRAAKTGDAFTLVTQEDEGTVRAIERVLAARIERRSLDGFNYETAPAHTLQPAARHWPGHGQASPRQSGPHQRPHSGSISASGSRFRFHSRRFQGVRARKENHEK